MADTNIILKYRRPQDSWLCPECDAENTLMYSRCSVCGCGKFGTPTIVKAWSEADEKPPAAPLSAPVSAPYNTERPAVGFGKMTPIFKDADRASGLPMYTPRKSHSNAWLIWTLVIVAIILLIIWMANNA